ncbi:polyprenyl synthetase family protein [Candidatus Woesearchaeota archaeon]|nr:polyprenyl synthetase family protein [Candidatus Woesearchaeota archaeon]
MDFGSYKYREDIEKALKSFLPDKLTADWAEKAIGKAKWRQDTEALTKTISEPVWDFLARGGKRWRPVLMLICCEIVGGKPSTILPFTVIPELIHNGTLIVDDIEDNSDLRRGKPVLHKIFGVDIAVNAGNAIYFLPYIAIQNSDLPETTKQRAYEVISTQLLKCHFGQAIDIWWHSGKSERIPSEEEYLQMCANKSGSLACMAAKLGALLGSGSEKQMEALGKFGETVGVVFQIQDDILNISEHESIGKKLGDDIKEGKRTLLVIHALNAAGEAQKTRLFEILNMHTKDDKLLKEAIAIIKSHNSIEYAKKTATRLVQEAWEGAEAALPDSEAKNQLKELSQLLLSRSV